MSALADLLQAKPVQKTAQSSGNSALAKLATSKQTQITSSEKPSIKTATIPSWLGGGAYNIDTKDPFKIVNTGHTNYGGVPAQAGMNRDDIVPVSLGGQNTNAFNIRTVKKENNPAQLESKLANLVKEGKMPINQARLEILTQKQNRDNPLPTQSVFKNFIKSVPEVLSAFPRKAASKVEKILANSGPVERATSVVQSIQQKSLQPLKESFKAQEKELMPQPGETPEQKIKKYSNLGLMMAVDAGGAKNEKPIKVNNYQTGTSFVSPSKILPTKLRETLHPVREMDQPTQQAFQDWTRGKLKAQELANQEASSVKVPEKQGLETILKYEQGQTTSFGKGIKQAFDKLHQEALNKGLDVPYRENYLPQVYKNSPEEITTAMSKYMKDKGVDPQLVKEYLDGKSLPESVATRLKLNPSFIKQRVLPDYQTAMEYGLTPKYTNPSQLLGHYKAELEKVDTNRQLIDNLASQGKIGPVDVAKPDWKPVELPFSQKGYYAEPKLAKMLNGIFRDESNLTFGQSVVKGVAKVSKKMQEIALSAGIPKTDVNFFSIGQLVKQVTAGDFKAIPAFIRANSNKASIRFFQENQPTLLKMADQGLDMGGRLGKFQDAYKNLVEPSIKSKLGASEGVVAKTKTIGSWLSENLGKGWHKAFDEKTFASFIPQLHIQTFKDAETKALAKGMSAKEAEKFAGDVTKNLFGLFENTGRSKTAEDTMSAVFFAPKFREGIMNTLANTLKSVTTEIRNPAFYKNRRLVAGMILTYAGYNALNKKLNGNYMWDNPSGKEFALQIPRKNGELVYIEFMPSFLAFARGLASGGIATARGDFKTAAQKFGSVFSMPVKLGSEVLSNKDYFGNPIYKETDKTSTKFGKSALHVGAGVNHPFIAQPFKKLVTQKDMPVHQMISTMMELPLKYSTKDKVNLGKLIELKNQKAKESARAKEDFKSTYDKVQGLIKQGKTNEAQSVVDHLSDDEYKLYKSMKSSEKSKSNLGSQSKILDTYNQIQGLIKQGKQNEAQSIVDKMTDEEYKAYKSLKNNH